MVSKETCKTCQGIGWYPKAVKDFEDSKGIQMKTIKFTCPDCVEKIMRITCGRCKKRRRPQIGAYSERLVATLNQGTYKVSIQGYNSTILCEKCAQDLLDLAILVVATPY